MSYKILAMLILYHTYLSTAYSKNSSNEKSYHTFEIELKIHLADSHLNEGKVEEAQKLFRQLVRKRKRELKPQEREKIIEISYKIQQHYDTLISQADTLFRAKNYEQASFLYNQIKRCCEKHCYPHTLSKQCRRQFLYSIHHRLACCYFLAGDYQKTIATLSERNKESYLSTKALKRLFWQGSFMQAAAYKRIGHHKPARELFSACAESLDCSLQKEAQVEAAFCALLRNDRQTAKEELLLLSKETLSDTLVLSALGLEILLEIDEGHFDKALILMETFNATLPHEYSYLYGYLSYRQGDLETAAIHFEKSIQQSSLTSNALYFLGYLYLQMAEENAFSPYQEQVVYIERAKNCFEALISHSTGHKKEKAFLGLASAHLAKAKYENNKITKKKLENLLAEASPISSEKTQYTLSILAAECSESTEEALQQYNKLLQKQHQHLSSYSKALFMNGNHLLEAGLAKPREVTAMISEHQQPCHKPKIVESLQWMHCLALSKEMQLENSVDVSPLVSALQNFLSCHPNSPHVKEALNMIGLLLWQKKDYSGSLHHFRLLLSHYPYYHKRDEALFYAALNSEQLGGEHLQHSASLHQELFSNYPDSMYAPESYFRLYNEKDYLSGNEKALLHLRNMPQSMNDSPFAAVSAFYVGRHYREQCPEKNISETHAKYLKKAIESFTFAQEKSVQFPYLRTIALCSKLEKARAFFILANNEYEPKEHLILCQQSLTQLKIAIEEGAIDPLLLSNLWQEAAWLQVRLHLLQAQKNEAREELIHMIEYCDKSGRPASEPFIKALCGLATMKGEEGQFDEAAKLTYRAEGLHTAAFSRELLLEIWIAKSTLYRQQGQLDKAMAILSKVINDTCASSLRIHAMYLRAEIYELKGRKELAVKQLEAIAKCKGIR